MSRYLSSKSVTFVMFIKKKCFGSPFFSGMLKLMRKKSQEHNQILTFRAQRSFSKPCPTRMVLSLMKLKSTACTSRRDELLFFTSSSLTPENLGNKIEATSSLSLVMILPVTSAVIISSIPGVVVNDFIGGPNKGVVDDLQTAVHHRNSHQFQTLSGIALKKE